MARHSASVLRYKATITAAKVAAAATISGVGGVTTATTATAATGISASAAAKLKSKAESVAALRDVSTRQLQAWWRYAVTVMLPLHVKSVTICIQCS
jgi:hypothetical protein